MAVTVSLTESDIFKALRAFLILVLPSGVEVIRAQINRVPAPKTVNYIVMNSSLRNRISTNTETWDQTNSSPVAVAALDPTQVTIQVDVHGPLGADYAWIITTLFRSPYACANFKAQQAAGGIDLTPLYVSDPKQMPFVNGEQQYEDRWLIEAVMQANVIVSVDQDFAAALEVGLIDVDAGVPGSLDFTNQWNSGLIPGL